jgi:glutathione peroxidase
VGFPCNDFGGQEPGDAGTIAGFCSSKYQVSFPMAGKVSIQGDHPDPIYDWLTHKNKNGVMDASVSWNFNKFLLDENGILLEKFGSNVNPLSDEITSRLQ